MEQIFKYLLQKQGYEHIGIIDAEKKIWGYAKDGIFHFCKEDLTEVKRDYIGLGTGIVVLAIEDDNLHVVDCSCCLDNSIVINGSNKIISSDFIGRKIEAFQKNIVKTSNGLDYGYESYYYDANGELLHIAKELKGRYSIFDIENRCFLNSIDRLQGVLDRRELCVVIPPIFKAINELDTYEGLYEVVFNNSVGSKEQELRGIYSARKGFIVPLGVEFHFPDYINLAVYSSVRPTNNSFIIYSIGNKDGLIFRGEKVLEPIYDAIEGFGFREESFGDSTNFISAKEIEKRTEEYYPLSVLIQKNRLQGLFIDKDHIIEPQFDMMICCKVLKENAFFIVQAGDKFGIISDNFEFNDRNKVIYDNVEIEDRYSDYKEIYFKVYQNGLVGMVSTNSKYSIPVQFNKLLIYPKCYIGDGFIYSRNGQKLLPEKDYEVIEAETLVILKNISSNEYVVYNYLGNLLDSNIKQESDSIIEIKGRNSCYEYDIHNMILTKIESNISYPHGDDYPTDDDIKKGLMEAYNGDPEALWNTE